MHAIINVNTAKKHLYFHSVFPPFAPFFIMAFIERSHNAKIHLTMSPLFVSMQLMKLQIDCDIDM